MPTTTTRVLTNEEVAAEFTRLVAKLALMKPVGYFRARPLDEALLQESLDHITEHPETHNQTVWASKTPSGEIVGCLAYHVLRIAGATLEWKKGDCSCGDPECQAGIECTLDGEAVSIQEGARVRLGLSHGEAAALFSPWTSITMMWRIAEEITEGRVTRKAAA